MIYFWLFDDDAPLNAPISTHTQQCISTGWTMVRELLLRPSAIITPEHVSFNGVLGDGGVVHPSLLQQWYHFSYTHCDTSAYRRPRVMTSVDIHCRSWNTWYIVRYYAASNESCMQYSTYLVLRDKAQVFCQLFEEFVFHSRFNRWVDLVILLWNGQWSHMCS